MKALAASGWPLFRSIQTKPLTCCDQVRSDTGYVRKPEEDHNFNLVTIWPGDRYNLLVYEVVTNMVTKAFKDWDKEGKYAGAAAGGRVE